MNREVRAPDLSPLARQRLTMFVGKVRSSDLDRPSDRMEEGKVVPGIDRGLLAGGAPEAMRHPEGGKAQEWSSFR
jgi:hypothetical protein